jgi:TRAP-type C4-dicarboxylate transport system permease small subunit
MSFLRRLDDIWADVEKALTFCVLISMVLIAGFTAFIRNLARFDLIWAGKLLMHFDWADSFLRKATLWLAFLGASLAVYYGKHINIDVFARIGPLRGKYAMRATSSLLAAAVAVGLTYAFSSAVYLNLTERPVEYEILPDNTPIHICDASDKALRDLSITGKPGAFCAIRSLFGLLGVPAESPGASAQVIVPIMFFIIGLRLFAQGVRAAIILYRGNDAIAAAEAEEARGAAEEAHAVDATGKMTQAEAKYSDVKT